MKLPPLTEARLKEAGIGVFFRPRDLKLLGISFRVLQQLVSTGAVQKSGPGLYRLAATKPTEFETIAMACSMAPRSIVCLLSALRVHGIGTQTPHEVWLALDRKARKPVRLGTKVRIVRFSRAMLTYGVLTRPILGVPVRITSPARTIVDCFRYRHKLGLDVAIEALRDGVRSRAASVDEIVRAADVCRARTVIKPYLEAR